MNNFTIQSYERYALLIHLIIVLFVYHPTSI